MDFRRRFGLLVAGVALIIITQILSCVWNTSRKFIHLDASESKEISGWSFQPIIESYHYRVSQGKPKDINGVWLYVKAMHSKIDEMEPMYGVDIDSIHVTCIEAEKKYTGIKYASVYGDILDDENIVNMFRFRSPTGEDYIIIPPGVDTIRVEFEAVFYMGIYRSFRPSAERDLTLDTVAVDASNPESFRQKVTMQLIMKESRTLVPGFL